MNFAIGLILLTVTFALTSARGIQNAGEEPNIISKNSDIPKSRGIRAVTKPGCSIRINDLGDNPQPLFLQPGTSSEWPVTSSGNMELAAGDALELFCTSTYANPSGVSGSQTATCVSGVEFKIGKTKYDITQVTCSSHPQFITRKTDEKCNGGEIFETGFPVGTRFVKNLDVCLNEEKEVTQYVNYRLTPANNEFQSNVARPGFTKGGLFGKKNMDNLYKTSNIIKTLAKAGLTNVNDFIIPKQTMFFSRGHMASKADFITANGQRSSHLFSNVAPQWQSFNAGNWLRVEDNTRNWVAKRNMTVDCWTGTYGITTLPNEDGVEIPLYLDYDKNNNGLVPVPKLFYRVIIEPSTKRGVVLLGVNNPYLTIEQIEKDYILCKDVSDKLDFLTWKKEDLKAGYSYACEVKDFAKKNPNLPKFDVKSLLY